MVTHAVMLAPTWPAEKFRRSIRNGSGAVEKTLVFERNDPQLLEESDFAAIKADLGASLVLAQVDSEGLPTGRVAKDDAEPKSRKKK